jgi:hypothetical protein
MSSKKVDWKNKQVYIRFKNKPVYELYDNLTFIEFENLWISVYKDASMLGVDFISESSWEGNWFERNPEVLKMIKNNDMNIAKKVASHKEAGISFLAKEILNGNKVIIKMGKYFLREDKEL